MCSIFKATVSQSAAFPPVNPNYKYLACFLRPVNRAGGKARSQRPAYPEDSTGRTSEQPEVKTGTHQDQLLPKPIDSSRVPFDASVGASPWSLPQALECGQKLWLWTKLIRASFNDQNAPEKSRLLTELFNFLSYFSWLLRWGKVPLLEGVSCVCKLEFRTPSPEVLPRSRAPCTNPHQPHSQVLKSDLCSRSPMLYVHQRRNGSERLTWRHRLNRRKPTGSPIRKPRDSAAYK